MAETKALEVRVEQKLGLLNWNFEELNQQLDSQLEKYRGLTFTDDQMPEAKKTRAALNKVAKEINDRKLAVKREFCAPYEQFEDQAKILIGKIKEVSGEIDQQVKDYEESKKQKKRQQIEDWWFENGKRTIKIEQIWDPRWLNTTYGEDWKLDLIRIKEKTTSDLSTITTLRDDAHPEKIDFLIEHYMKTLDLNKTIAAWEDHVIAQENAKAERERLEQERLQREAYRAEMAAKRAETEAKQAEAPAAEETDGPEAYLYSPTFKLIDLTYQEALDLTNYMKDHKLRFVSIAKEKRRK